MSDYKFKLAQRVADFGVDFPGFSRIARTWADAIELGSDSPENVAMFAPPTPRTPDELRERFEALSARVLEATAGEEKRTALLRLMFFSAWWATLSDGGPVGVHDRPAVAAHVSAILEGARS